MVISALYNIVDTLFVGRGVGPIAIAALTIVLPIQIIMMAIGFMIGSGSASIISRSLGKKKKDTAINTAGNAILLNLAINIVLMVISFIFIDKFLIFLGASKEVLPYAKDYMGIILLGFIFLSFCISSNNIIRAEGRPRAAMYSMVIGAVLNIILDPIFIFVFKMGIRGVAIATIISQIASCIYIIFYFMSGESIFHFSPAMFKIKKDLIKNILLIGFPSFLMAVIDSVIFLIFNRAILYYGNDLYIAISGITIRIIDFTLMPIIGIAQGFSTIIGFNYGAKLYPRVKKVLKEAVAWTTAIASVGFIIIMFFPKPLLSLFSGGNEIIANSVLPMRIIAIFLPLLGFLIIGGSLFQAIGKPSPALIITLSRQLLFLIPSILILPLFFSLNGVWLSWPVSDFLAFLVTSIFVYKEIKTINKTLKAKSI
jgi:putative MATE family efflux protein